MGSPESVESIWLEKEAKKRKHRVKRISLNDVYFDVRNKKFEVHSKDDFCEFDIFLVRGISKNYSFESMNFDKINEVLLLLKYLYQDLGKIIVDEKLVKAPYLVSKMNTSLELSRAGLKQPKTIQYISKNTILENISDFSYPIIVKSPIGRKGVGIYKVKSEQELMSLLNKAQEAFPYLFQEFLPNDGDIRVLVVGYKAIGAMKRFIVPGDFRSNISQGAKAEKYVMTEDVKKIAEAAAIATKTEFAGVDLIESEGEFYVIEVNRAPQFRGFRKYVRLDPSPFVIDYLEKKFENLKKAKK